MNQEYLRQTVKKLLWLSDYIVSENDSRSDNYWENHLTFIYGRVQKLTELLQEAKELKKIEILTIELYVDNWLMRQNNLARLLETDPFIPKKIREQIANFYTQRAVQMGLIYTKVMGTFCQELYEGKIRDNVSELKMQAWIRLGDAYFKKGWGWEKTEKRIIQLRSQIEKYLTSLK